MNCTNRSQLKVSGFPSSFLEVFPAEYGTFSLYFGSELASATCFYFMVTQGFAVLSRSLSSAGAAHLRNRSGTDKKWFIINLY